MDSRGFTLVEIIVALTIFAVGILAVATLQISSMQSNTKANLLTQAGVLAQGKMEELVALNFNHPSLQDLDLDGTAGLGDSGFDDNNETDGDADFGPDPDNGQFGVYWNIAENVPAVAGVGTKTIRVVVRWQERGQLKNTTISYVKSN